VKKDREMTQYIEKFDAKKQDLLNATHRSQQLVVRFLEHISDDLARRSDIPSARRFKKMKDELDFKKRQVGSSSFFFVFFLS
jgi:hypothetical protein